MLDVVMSAVGILLLVAVFSVILIPKLALALGRYLEM